MSIEKKVLTLQEACEYTGIKRSYMWKLTHLRRIPHSKPLGGKIYFDKDQLDKWLLGNPVTSSAPLASDPLFTKPQMV